MLKADPCSHLLVASCMVETFYVHLEFAGKIGGWSINLPFLCSKCGVCCKLEDFLTAGITYATPQTYPELHAKLQTLYYELGKLWEKDESKYDLYTQHTNCPFLIDKGCVIYEIRPDGCRLFPNSTYGMQTTDCSTLTRFKKQCNALKKGRACTEHYYFTGKIQCSTECDAAIKPTRFTEKQYRTFVSKLRQVGITDDELAFFNNFNLVKP